MAEVRDNQIRHEVADPEEVGVDPSSLKALRQRALREIEQGLLPSCQLAIARRGKLAYFETLGEADPQSRYIVFSVTKGVIAGAVWVLVGEGMLRWDTRVSDVVPGFSSNGKEKVTVEHLLTHTAGFPFAPMWPHEGLDPERRAERFSEWRIDWEPGTKFEYHPLSAHWVLADIIERLSGMDYRRFIKERIFDTLGLGSFSSGEPPEQQKDVNALTLVGEPPTSWEIAQAFGLEIDVSSLRSSVSDQALIELGRPEILAVGLRWGRYFERSRHRSLLPRATPQHFGNLERPSDLRRNRACMRAS